MIQTFPEGEPVWGMTLLENHLYVLRGHKSSEQIEIYDIDSCRLLCAVTVPGLGAKTDIVGCGYNRCAYISDYSHSSVHRVTLRGPITCWPVNDTPIRLSVTHRHTVLVSCGQVRRIKEFSTNGRLLRVVTLECGMLPWHTIQLSTGQFLVCVGHPEDQFHSVCLISSGGIVVKSFGGPIGSGSQQMSGPAHMAVDRNGFVFVVDQNNSRVLLLSPQLTYVRDVLSFNWRPQRVHLDSDRGRLYVADNELKDEKFTAGRVFVVNV